jgi:hypothetical protein
MPAEKDEKTRDKLEVKRKLSQVSADLEKIAKKLSYLELANESAFLKNALKQIKRAERSL